MRRLSYVLTVAAAVLVLPTLAMAGNQEVAEKVATNLRQSGQLQGYKVGVKVQEGTAWLRGRVSSHEQMNAALRLAFQTDGVERVVNNLTVSSGPQSPTLSPTPAPGGKKVSVSNLLGKPLRQVSGATAPERRLERPTAAFRRTTATKVATQAPTNSLKRLQQATPVETTFQPTSAQPVAAEEKSEPMVRRLSQMQAPPVPIAEQPRLVAQAQPMPVARPMPVAQPMSQPVPVGYVQNQGRCTNAAIHGSRWFRCRSGAVRPAGHAQLRLAKLCGPPQLRRCHLSEVPFGHGVGPTSVPSIPIRRYPSDGGRSPSNGMTASGISTSTMVPAEDRSLVCSDRTKPVAGKTHAFFW